MSALAAFVCQRREQITPLWIEAVRKDPEIASAAAVSDDDLIGHLPKLFDDLADALRGKPAAARIARNAELHGEHRWEKHYSLTEALRELGILRRLIFSQGLDAFKAASKEELEVARERTLRFFEDSSAGRVQAFTKRQHAQLDALSGQLRAADRSLAIATHAERDRLAYVFKHSPSFMAILGGPEHVFEVINDRYHDLVARRDVLHKPVREALPEVADQGFFELLDGVYASGEPFIGNDVQILLQDEAGRPKEYFLDFVYLPIRAADGTISGVFVHGVDLTARKNTEKALAEVAEQRRLALDAARMGWWRLDLIKKQVYMDERFGAIFGLVGKDLAQKDVNAAIHPDDVRKVETAADAAIQPARPVPYSMEYRVIHPDGAVRWVQANGRAHFAGEGDQRRAVSLVGTIVDVTEAKTAQDALHESEARFRQLADAMPQIVWSGRADGHIDYYNEQWYDFTGSERGKTGNESWENILHPDDVKMVAKAWNAATAADQPYELVYRLRNAAQQDYRWVLGRGLPFKDASGKVVRWYGTCTDIHERKQLSEQNAQLLESERAARAEAERSSRMKDEFLATLSHELRTPLNAILGWTQVLRDGHADADDLAHGLTTIERNARVQTQIIEDLLEMSRIISGKVRLDVQRVDLAPVVQAAIDTMLPTAEAKGVRLQVVLDPAARPVSGDPNRLQQVFWNLLSNAIKFTPKGGRVQVVLERVNSHLEVSVIDTGEGIAPEFLPQVFDRFRQADASTTRRHGGLGLGLAIVKQLVELHGGSVHVHSAGSNQGTTFRVLLPLTVLHPMTDPAEAERRHPRADSSSLSVSSERFDLAGVKVLVVDDEADARGLVKRVLEDRQAAVRTAGSAAEAMELIRAEPPDVLVSDVGMPEEDGYSLIRRVRALGPENGGNIPAIALTAYARAEDRLKTIMAGFQIHVAKPVDTVELLALVASLTGRTGSSHG